ncbi:hypothetical protein GW819_00825 [Candidatus Gracilibacteria bacterium]|nr:hypothetical protein [bacterium]NDK19364.1 hypothetical protein [Candidatus Gracilibacteria bacterium]OIO77444.1 MAG: hypothetical protein AUJ87_01260 [Candidatus Gracilibacteria bacterium CG1_02_38_174]PIQ10862.1 MAG: hypothetical protein COW68_03660 [Candidatus Gracilibacteria bacterium CG18_big_fil_WC_8_21_14_2_50_38_16]PIQ41195.1 MAG: hypothetical protein COW06_03750 [Candidatus Gracilibacteria bacterium CG12_big_fil_rev_8_21_14_0_65_38_15]PIZ01532.1 MAG: hypothetical protein COY60_0307
MSYDEKALKDAGLGVSGARKTMTKAKENELVQMLERAKNGMGQLMIAPTGTIYDADSEAVRTAPKEVQDSLNHTSTLEQSF